VSCCFTNHFQRCFFYDAGRGVGNGCVMFQLLLLPDSYACALHNHLCTS
jgi:hypothetical protein